MPDPATWVLTLGTPLVAGGVAVWINERRMKHDATQAESRLKQERRIARDNDLRTLLREGARLLRLPEHDATAEEYFDWANALLSYGVELELWFSAAESVTTRWEQCRHIAERLATNAHVDSGGKAYLGSVPVEPLSVSDRMAAQTGFSAAATEWVVAARATQLNWLS